MKFPMIGGVAFFVSGAAALAAVAMMSPAGSEAAPAPAAEVASAKPVESGAATALVLSVPGMHCEFACAPTVRETLAGVPGVEKVETDVETQKVTVVAGDGFDLAKALAALEGAGYPGKVAAR